MSYGNFKLDNQDISSLVRVNWARTTNDERETANLFIKETADEKISAFSSGKSLDSLIDKLEVLQRLPKNGNDYCQFEANKPIFFRLRKAIHNKQSYYENNIFGMITKLFLKIIGQWNEGKTPCIQRAERISTELFKKLDMDKSYRGKGHGEFGRVQKEIHNVNRRYNLFQAMQSDGLIDKSELYYEDECLFPWEKD